MAFTKLIDDLKGILILMLLGLPLIASANIDCSGKSFHCLNSTHFMICVDLGGGISSTVDDFVIPCPPSTVCLGTNRFECEFPPSTPAPILVTTASEVTNDTISSDYTVAWEEINVTSTAYRTVSKDERLEINPLDYTTLLNDGVITEVSPRKPIIITEINVNTTPSNFTTTTESLITDSPIVISVSATNNVTGKAVNQETRLENDTVSLTTLLEDSVTTKLIPTEQMNISETNINARENNLTVTTDTLSSEFTTANGISATNNVTEKPVTDATRSKINTVSLTTRDSVATELIPTEQINDSEVILNATENNLTVTTQSLSSEFTIANGNVTETAVNYEAPLETYTTSLKTSLNDSITTELSPTEQLSSIQINLKAAANNFTPTTKPFTTESTTLNGISDTIEKAVIDEARSEMNTATFTTSLNDNVTTELIQTKQINNSNINAMDNNFAANTESLSSEFTTVKGISFTNKVTEKAVSEVARSEINTVSLTTSLNDSVTKEFIPTEQISIIPINLNATANNITASTESLSTVVTTIFGISATNNGAENAVSNEARVEINTDGFTTLLNDSVTTKLIPKEQINNSEINVNPKENNFTVTTESFSTEYTIINGISDTNNTTEKPVTDEAPSDINIVTLSTSLNDSATTKLFPTKQINNSDINVNATNNIFAGTTESLSTEFTTIKGISTKNKVTEKAVNDEERLEINTASLTTALNDTVMTKQSNKIEINATENNFIASTASLNIEITSIKLLPTLNNVTEKLVTDETRLDIDTVRTTLFIDTATTPEITPTEQPSDIGIKLISSETNFTATTESLSNELTNINGVSTVNNVTEKTIINLSDENSLPSQIQTEVTLKHEKSMSTTTLINDMVTTKRIVPEEIKNTYNNETTAIVTNFSDTESTTSGSSIISDENNKNNEKLLNVTDHTRFKSAESETTVLPTKINENIILNVNDIDENRTTPSYYDATQLTLSLIKNYTGTIEINSTNLNIESEKNFTVTTETLSTNSLNFTSLLEITNLTETVTDMSKINENVIFNTTIENDTLQNNSVYEKNKDTFGSPVTLLINTSATTELFATNPISDTTAKNKEILPNSSIFNTKSITTESVTSVNLESPTTIDLTIVNNETLIETENITNVKAEFTTVKPINESEKKENIRNKLENNMTESTNFLTIESTTSISNTGQVINAESTDTFANNTVNIFTVDNKINDTNTTDFDITSTNTLVTKGKDLPTTKVFLANTDTTRNPNFNTNTKNISTLNILTNSTEYELLISNATKAILELDKTESNQTNLANSISITVDTNTNTNSSSKNLFDQDEIIGISENVRDTSVNTTKPYNTIAVTNENAGSQNMSEILGTNVIYTTPIIYQNITETEKTLQNSTIVRNETTNPISPKLNVATTEISASLNEDITEFHNITRHETIASTISDTIVTITESSLTDAIPDKLFFVTTPSLNVDHQTQNLDGTTIWSESVIKTTDITTDTTSTTQTTGDTVSTSSSIIPISTAQIEISTIPSTSEMESVSTIIPKETCKNASAKQVSDLKENSTFKIHEVITDDNIAALLNTKFTSMDISNKDTPVTENLFRSKDLTTDTLPAIDFSAPDNEYLTTRSSLLVATGNVEIHTMTTDTENNDIVVITESYKNLNSSTIPEVTGKNNTDYQNGTKNNTSKTTKSTGSGINGNVYNTNETLILKSQNLHTTLPVKQSNTTEVTATNTIEKLSSKNKNDVILKNTEITQSSHNSHIIDIWQEPFFNIGDKEIQITTTPTNYVSNKAAVAQPQEMNEKQSIEQVVIENIPEEIHNIQRSEDTATIEYSENTIFETKLSTKMELSDKNITISAESVFSPPDPAIATNPVQTVIKTITETNSSTVSLTNIDNKVSNQSSEYNQKSMMIMSVANNSLNTTPEIDRRTLTKKIEENINFSMNPPSTNTVNTHTTDSLMLLTTSLNPVIVGQSTPQYNFENIINSSLTFVSNSSIKTSTIRPIHKATEVVNQTSSMYSFEILKDPKPTSALNSSARTAENDLSTASYSYESTMGSNPISALNSSMQINDQYNSTVDSSRVAVEVSQATPINNFDSKMHPNLENWTSSSLAKEASTDTITASEVYPVGDVHHSIPNSKATAAKSKLISNKFLINSSVSLTDISHEYNMKNITDNSSVLSELPTATKTFDESTQTSHESILKSSSNQQTLLTTNSYPKATNKIKFEKGEISGISGQNNYHGTLKTSYITSSSQHNFAINSTENNESGVIYEKTMAAFSTSEVLPVTTPMYNTILETTDVTFLPDINQTPGLMELNTDTHNVYSVDVKKETYFESITQSLASSTIAPEFSISDKSRINDYLSTSTVPQSNQIHTDETLPTNTRNFVTSTESYPGYSNIKTVGIKSTISAVGTDESHINEPNINDDKVIKDTVKNSQLSQTNRKPRVTNVYIPKENTGIFTSQLVKDLTTKKDGLSYVEVTVDISPLQDRQERKVTSSVTSFTTELHTPKVGTTESHLTNLQFDCNHRKRGRFADNDDCRKFYTCIGLDKPIFGLCPVNTVFSDIKKQCTKNLSHCIRDNQFKCVSEGRFGDFKENNVYYICVKNSLNTFVRFKFRCQNSYYLDQASVKCVRNSEPLNQSVSTDSISKSVADKQQSNEYVKPKKKENRFECEDVGKFADPKNCRKYYVCSKSSKSDEFRKRRKKCDSEEVFHKDKKKCVDAESYECS